MGFPQTGSEMTNGCRPSRLRSIDEANCVDPGVVAIEQRHDEAREGVLRVDLQHAFEEIPDVARRAVPQQGYRRVMTQQRWSGFLRNAWRRTTSASSLRLALSYIVASWIAISGSRVSAQACSTFSIASDGWGSADHRRCLRARAGAATKSVAPAAQSGSTSRARRDALPFHSSEFDRPMQKVVTMP